MSAVVAAAHEATGTPMIAVDQLGVSFSRDGKRLQPVREVSFSLRRGETLCIIGESGSGKSLTLRALIGQMPQGARLDGAIWLRGRDVTHVSAEERRKIRGAQIGTIFQEPATALDPVYTIGRQITEAIMAHQEVKRDVAAGRALELLELVAIPNAKRRFSAFPHELSGGMRQRAMIAVALACRPDVLLADEPTTALDVTVQMQILLLLRRLQLQFGMSVIFVTHDIAVAAEVGDQIAVMYAGTIVETGTAEQVLLEPQHPYTRALLASRATAASRGSDIPTIAGGPPNPADLPSGCAFHPRCRHMAAVCTTSPPAARSVGDHRIIRCWKPELEAPGDARGQVGGRQ
jgi:peptide/nickel transport system ATP-binding protein